MELFPALPSCIAILMRDSVLQQGTSPQTSGAIAALRPLLAPVGQSGLACLSADFVQTFDLKQPLELPVDEYDSMEKLLASEERREDINRNAWKVEAWSMGEDFGWNNWEKASLTYFKCVMFPPLGCFRVGACLGHN